MRNLHILFSCIALGTIVVLCLLSSTQSILSSEPDIDQGKSVQSRKPAPATFPSVVERDRALPGHVQQSDIEAKLWSIKHLQEAGRRIFVARFTKQDGVGRPGATGNPVPTRRSHTNDTGFMRSSGPDANSCGSCHNSPMPGGAGDFTTNVFVELGKRDPPVNTVDRAFANERGTPDLNGLGVIELLAREITAQLHTIRDAAIQQAKQQNKTVRVPLQAKGIQFGALTAEPDGNLLYHEIEGIDNDLVIKPFGQKGTVVSLREFSITAANLHHGMQARERFGSHYTGTKDFDGDQVADELTEGDITALTLFQASINLPGQVLPAAKAAQQQIDRGKKLFAEVKCNSCHVMELPLETPVFTEPGPYNYEGTLRLADVPSQVSLDLTSEISSPKLSKNAAGKIVVKAFTDFKRHIISDSERPHFGNELLLEKYLPFNTFLTKRLWATGNTAPYGHRGDLPTIREAISHHGGEAEESRRKFDSLKKQDQKAIIEFLRSLQILEEGSPDLIIREEEEQLPYQNSRK